MRFLLFNSCRDHPELKGYSDEEFLRLVMEARARRGDAMWVAPLAIIIAATLAGMLAAAVMASIVHTSRTAAGQTFTFWADPVVRAIFSWAIVVIGPTNVVIWLVARRELILRSVLRHLVRARCPYCLFNLAGLPVEIGAVTCPECGQRIVLADEGISPDDILPREKRYRTWTAARYESQELPPIPLEPEAAPGRKKRIQAFGSKRGG